MSKRFGRNQKRAMRAHIAAAEAVAQERLKHAESLRREVKYLREELNDAKELAGRMCVLFPAQQIEGGPKRSRVQIIEESHPSIEHAMSSALATVRVFSLPVLIAKIDRDYLKSAIHAEVSFSDGTYGYGITREAMASMSQVDLSRRIARELAPLIAAELKKVGQ